MKRARLEAFSDGVIAIIITIMVLELERPHGTSLADLGLVVPPVLRYLLSFVYVGIYWVNHHALFDEADRLDPRHLWANLHLLFWMSLIPFVTEWIGAHPLDPVPVALYGAVLLMCSIAFALVAALIRGADAVWRDRRNLLSIALYALAIVLAPVYAPASSVIHVAVALLWLSPGRHLDKH